MPQTLPGFLIVIGVLLLLTGFLLGAGRVVLGPIKLPKLGLRARPLQLWGGIFTLLGVGMYLVGFIPLLSPSPTAMPATETPPAPPPTSTSTPTLIPTLTSTITPTHTPLPPPLLEIFPQAVDGVEFAFTNDEGVLTPQFIVDQTCIHSGVYGLRLTYDMKGLGNGGWGVHWVNPPSITHFDASKFQTLTFWVRGAAGNESFQIAMKDTNGNSFWVESRTKLVVTSSWTMVSIPFSEFQGVNTTSLENFTFGANNTHDSGSICIDDIAFVATP